MIGDRAPLPRCGLVWLAVTVGVAAGLRALLPLDLSAGSFDRLLPQLAAVALAGCLAWCWWVTTWTAVGAARGRVTTTIGCPRSVQRLLVTLCGVAAVSAAAPALADPGTGSGPSHHLIAGLQLPDRATTGPLITGPSTAPPLVVRPGDTLWGLAVGALPPGASDAEITAGWHALYAANRDAVADPDLIYPGQVLDPAPGKHTTEEDR